MPSKVDAARERSSVNGCSRAAASSSLAGRSGRKSEYGIEVVDIRLRRSNHPPAVREAIFERIRSERSKKKAEYESEGEQLKQNIESEGRKRVEILKAEAEAKSRRLKSAADVEAESILNEAHKKDPAIFHVPQEAGGISAHPRRQQEYAVALNAPRIV